MKARVKATGEIVSVKVYNKGFDYNGRQFINYEDTKTRKTYEDNQLDFDNTDNSPDDYWERLRHQYTGMATADRKWYDMEKRLPIPTDGEDFLVKVENCEEQYAYAWYAYDRQCFMCYATGLSLGTAVRYYKPIIAPM